MVTKTTCIMCPLGCELEITKTGKQDYKVTGNTCPRGEVYGKTEMTNPTRTISTLIKLNSGGVVPVKTSSPIPKMMIDKVLKEISKITLKTKPKMGTIVIKNILGLNSDIVAIGL